MQESRQIARLNFTGSDPYFDNLLKDIEVGKHVSQFKKNTLIFCQGDEADAIYFIRSGMVKVIVWSALVSFLEKDAWSVNLSGWARRKHWNRPPSSGSRNKPCFKLFTLRASFRKHLQRHW
jgi:hypothetical protein